MHFLSNKYKINCKSIFNIFGLLQFINKSRNDKLKIVNDEIFKNFFILNC